MWIYWFALVWQDPFATCRQAFVPDPRDYRPAKCFYDVARGQGLWNEAGRQLEALLEGGETLPWVHFYLGNIAQDRMDPAALDHYRVALDAFDETGDGQGMVYTQINLHRVLTTQNLWQEAERALAAAQHQAMLMRDASLIYAATLDRGMLLKRKGSLEQAQSLLEQLEPRLFREESSYSTRRDCLLALGDLAEELGQPRRAREYYAALLDLAEKHEDPYAAAVASLNTLISLVGTGPWTPATRDEASQLAARLRETSQALEHQALEVRVLYEAAMLADTEQADRYLAKAQAMTRELGDPELESLVLRGLAARRVDRDPQAAQNLIGRSYAAAAKSEDPAILLTAWCDRMHVDWISRPPAEALARSLDLLDLIEAVRETQSSDIGRAGFLSHQAFSYYALVGHLSRLFREERDLTWAREAHRVMERLRARSLLESLSFERINDLPDEMNDLTETRRGLDRQWVRLHQDLLNPDLSPEARASKRQLREALTAKIGAQDARIRAKHAGYGGRQSLQAASLEQVQAALEPHQALLSYQLSYRENPYGQFYGGSWLWVVTNAGVEVYELADRAAIEPAVDTFRDLCAEGKHTQQIRAGAEALYRRLMERALADLPEGIEELVIIPDGHLYHLPFSLLQSAANHTPLAFRYHLTLVPSATLWLRWSKQNPQAKGSGALVFSDPRNRAIETPLEESPDSGGWERLYRGTKTVTPADLIAGAKLGPLPYARSEARSVVRHVGRDSELLMGDRASEKFLKQQDLRQYKVLHFAAHAVIDEVRPQRSAIILAPGSDEEDGFLTPREIERLDLDGQVVVLSTCHGASGLTFRGEGVMSLARSFLQAGATTVIGTLQPLSDQNAEVLFDTFYRHLANGLPVSRAMSMAQRHCHEANQSVATWSNVVVLGNGHAVLFDEPDRESLPVFVWALVAFSLISLLVGVVRRQRRHTRS
ncbi:CHAT domain-containing protein [Sulfidibacter corallicola]|uniref:CHAT domain-containing protein n=1 Tax=Sulfidibacter corallicola TaxID=2818388 RepID=A0A8A4TG32_SULCO|nr:CHAT domain-containing protein [Sulfidibacter corallicola]QTD48142.1 CHAT domain-containing protein [Sulfidibacter corallicola]